MKARLTVHQPDGSLREIVLPAKPVTIGKTPDNDIVIADGAISRSHAEIEKRANGVFIKDLNSLNGTFVNKQKLGEHELRLNDGDEISVGRSKIAFRLEPITATEIHTTAEDDIPRVTTTIAAVTPLPPPPLPTPSQPKPTPLPPEPPPRITALSIEKYEATPPEPIKPDSARFKVRQTGELEIVSEKPAEAFVEKVQRLAQPILLDGRYELTQQLAQDENGTLYRARRTMLGDEVAVRVLRPELVSDPVAVERFRRQAKVAAQIKHPNSVQIFDFGHRAEGATYIVEELLSGRTLRDLIKEERALSLPRVVGLMNQICGAVHAAHLYGIVLRGLKPETIYVEYDQHGKEAIKVGGYSLAKIDDSVVPTETGQSLTGPLGVLGSPQYTSPEQWMNR
ncbi:MAG: FHA domain-containing serine/threonine-protein kinase, partial [Acidobacteriota bacterium]